MKRTEEVLALVAKLEAARGEDLKVLALYHLPELLEIARDSAGRATQWVKGTGSDLPDGTVAWVAYRTQPGLACARESRRTGGWGWLDLCDDSDDRPRFSDDGDPDLYLHPDVGYVFGKVAIVAYLLQPTPEPPKDDR